MQLSSLRNLRLLSPNKHGRFRYLGINSIIPLQLNPFDYTVMNTLRALFFPFEDGLLKNKNSVNL